MRGCLTEDRKKTDEGLQEENTGFNLCVELVMALRVSLLPLFFQKKKLNTKVAQFAC